MNSETIIKHWIESSDRDYQTMNNLYDKGDYTWSLFIGHIILEKLIKALYVSINGDTPPFSHNLLYLAQKAGLKCSEQQKDYFDEITTFNIRSRYDDIKMQFYKKCTMEYTQQWIKEIKVLRKWIKNRLSKQEEIL